VLIHLLDGATNDPLEDWAMINQELALYDARLEEKPQLIVLNKIDLPEAESLKPLVGDKVIGEGLAFCAISAITKQGVREMLYLTKRLLDESPLVSDAGPDIEIIRPTIDEELFYIEREELGWRVHGKRIERIAAMTYWEFEATTRRFQQILERMGIHAALVKAGIASGDNVFIGDEQLEWTE